MTAQTITIFFSTPENSSIKLNYDDVTLLATSLTLSCGPQARHQLSWWVELTSGASSHHTGAVGVGAAISTYTFPSPIQGVLVADPKGGPNILTWPFKFIGFAHAAQVVPPSAV
jgi:hypothetical protein